MVRTPGSQPGNRGSIPRGGTTPIDFFMFDVPLEAPSNRGVKWGSRQQYQSACIAILRDPWYTKITESVTEGR